MQKTIIAGAGITLASYAVYNAMQLKNDELKAQQELRDKLADFERSAVAAAAAAAQERASRRSRKNEPQTSDIDTVTLWTGHVYFAAVRRLKAKLESQGQGGVWQVRMPLLREQPPADFIVLCAILMWGDDTLYVDEML